MSQKAHTKSITTKQGQLNMNIKAKIKVALEAAFYTVVVGIVLLAFVAIGIASGAQA